MRHRTLTALASLATILMLSGCSSWTLLAAVTPGNGTTRLTDIRYGNGPRQALDLYLPAGVMPQDGATASLRQPVPVVVFFYGGTWRSGEREQYRFVGKALAARGILTAVADYRLYPEVSYPEFLRDNAAAVSWAFREIGAYGGDPARVFVMGHSAGAYNAAMIAMDPRWLGEVGLAPSRLKGWIGLAGPYDFLPIENPDAKPVFHHPDYPPGTQPIDHAGATVSPTFLGAGRDDETVNPIRSTRQLADKLQAAGVEVDVHLYPGVGHLTMIGAFAGPGGALGWFGPVVEDVSGFVLAR